MAPPTIRLEASRSEAWKCLIKAFLLRIETAVVDDSVLQCLKEEAKQEGIVFYRMANKWSGFDQE